MSFRYCPAMILTFWGLALVSVLPAKDIRMPQFSLSFSDEWQELPPESTEGKSPVVSTVWRYIVVDPESSRKTSLLISWTDETTLISDIQSLKQEGFDAVLDERTPKRSNGKPEAVRFDASRNMIWSLTDSTHAEGPQKNGSVAIFLTNGGTLRLGSVWHMPNETALEEFHRIVQTVRIAPALELRVPVQITKKQQVPFPMNISNLIRWGIAIIVACSIGYRVSFARTSTPSLPSKQLDDWLDQNSELQDGESDTSSQEGPGDSR